MYVCMGHVYIFCRGLCIGILLMYVVPYPNYVYLCMSAVYFCIPKCVHSYECIYKSRLAQAALCYFPYLVTTFVYS